MAKVTLSSNSIEGNNSLIDAVYKNNIVDNQYNDSPELRWATDIDESYIDYFNLYCVCIDLKSQREYSPDGNFIHWAVEKIQKTQKPFVDDSVYGITRNGYWYSAKTIVRKTDYVNGDRINGWNGPGADTNENYTYHIWVEAIIKNSKTIIDIVGDDKIQSNIIVFTDSKDNLNNSENTNDCWKKSCKEGYNYNSDRDKCIREENDEVKSKYDTYQLFYPSTSGEIAIFDSYDFTEKNNSEISISYNRDNGFIINSDVEKDTEQITFTFYNSHGLNTLYYKPDDIYLNAYKHIAYFDLRRGIREDGIYRIFFLINLIDYENAKEKNNEFEIYICGNTIKFRLGSEYNGDYNHLYISLKIKIDLSDPIIKIIANKEHETTYLCDIKFVIYKEDNYGTDIFGKLGGASKYIACNKVMPNSEGKCVFEDIIEPDYKDCYYEIEKCNDVKTIGIKTKNNERLRKGYIYKFKDTSELKDPSTGNPYCYKVKELIEGTGKTIDNVVIDEEVGDSSIDGICDSCNSLHKFVSCDSSKKDVVTTLNSASLIPTKDYIYNMSFCEYTGEFSHYEFNNEEFTEEYKKDCECYKYVGTTQEEKTHNNLYVKTNFQTQKCGYCDGCYKFKNCITDEFIIVSLKDGLSIEDSQIEHVFKLKGNPNVEGNGWIYYGNEDCDSETVTYDDIDAEDTNSKSCDAFYPYYELTNCTNKDDVHRAYMVNNQKLDVTKSYVFPQSPFCYTAKPLEIAVEPDETAWRIEKYDEVHDDCDECNATCYYIEECETGERFKPVNQIEIATYLERTIKFAYNTDLENIKCGTVHSYRCHSKEYDEIDITLFDGCYSSCEDCNKKVKAIKEFSVKHRCIRPNRKEYICCDPPKVKDKCNNKVCCNGKYIISSED